jgi:hypothetical protein
MIPTLAASGHARHAALARVRAAGAPGWRGHAEACPKKRSGGKARASPPLVQRWE